MRSLSLFEQIDGWRYQLLSTNTPTSGATGGGVLVDSFSKPATARTLACAAAK